MGIKPAKEYPIIYLPEHTYGKHCWVIRTINEEYPRYIEMVHSWKKNETNYGLVPNIHFAKVWIGISPPYRAIEKFEKTTGLEACFQEVPLVAYERYKSYEEYYLGHRELTEEEEEQLKEEWYEWRMNHDLEMGKR